VHRGAIVRGFAQVHPGRASALAVLATFAILQPALAPFFPHLAGWQPEHGHVYTSAAAASHAHAHPYDAPSDHHAVPADTNSEVIFVFADDVTGSALPQIAVPLIVAPQSQAIRIARFEPPLTGVPAAPSPPPPRA